MRTPRPRHGGRLRGADRPRPGPRRAIVGANRTFGALASQSKALSDTFKIFPTFENESRLTLDRLKGFAQDARPLFHDLKPVARDLSPTLRKVRQLAPKAHKLFQNFDPLIKASATGLPSLSSFLRELRPVTDSLDPFLANFNPFVRWLDYQAPVVTDFLSNPSSSTADFLPTQAGQSAPLHLSRQMSLFTAETLSIYQQRINTNRGNGYLQPFAIGSPYPSANAEIFPSHDCNNTLGGHQVLFTPTGSFAPAGGAPQSESGQFPESSQVPAQNPSFVAPNSEVNATSLPPGGPAAYAGCTTAPGFPSAFGGGSIPEVLPDP